MWDSHIGLQGLVIGVCLVGYLFGVIGIFWEGIKEDRKWKRKLDVQRQLEKGEVR